MLKLFQIVQPTHAYFGEKDAQQTALIRRLVFDFNLELVIVEVPTVREPDGLAISSRNVHLSEDERQLAVALYHALREGRRQVAIGERDAAQVRSRAAGRVPSDSRLRLEYLDLVDPKDMRPVGHIVAPVRIAGALWVGRTRLIDNMMCVPGDDTAQKKEH